MRWTRVVVLCCHVRMNEPRSQLDYIVRSTLAGGIAGGVVPLFLCSMPVLALIFLRGQDSRRTVRPGQNLVSDSSS